MDVVVEMDGTFEKECYPTFDEDRFEYDMCGGLQ